MRQCMRFHMLAGAAATLAAATGANAGLESESTDEVRAMVAEMLADAEGRSSLLQGGAAGRVQGDENGYFFIRSGDEFELAVRGQLQFRYIFNFGEEIDDDDDFVPFGSDDDFESGFQAARTRLFFEGRAFGNIDYRVNGDFDTSGGEFTLQNAWVKHNFDNFAFRWGQFKLPFLREELVMSSRQLAVERSYVNETWTQDYSQGIEVQFRAGEQLKFWVAFSDGFRSANTDFLDTATVTVFDADGDGTPELGGIQGFGFANQGGAEAEAALTGRVEFLGAGQWDQFSDFTGMPGTPFGWLVGAAVHWETTDDGSVFFDGAEVATGDSDFLTWTVDLSFEGDGWNIFGAYVGSYTDIEFSEVDDSGVEGQFEPVDHGFVVQGGWFIPETEWELFARYDLSIFDEDERNADEDTFSAITAGVNYYMHGHAAKFTGDVVYFIDDFNIIQDQNLQAGRVGGADDDEWAVRLQMQFLF